MKKTHSSGIVYTVSLIVLFLILSSIIIYMGVGSYNRVDDIKKSNAEAISTISYITGKLKSAKSTDGIYGEIKDGVNTLVINSGDYNTVIYYADGYIREALMIEGFEFSKDMGETITKADSFSFDIDDNQVLFTVDIDDDTYSSNVAIRR